MAKSLRSKTQRKNRAVKRERYAKKEKARLEKIVELAKETVAAQDTKSIYKTLESENPDESQKMAVDNQEKVENVITVPDVDEDLDDMPIGVGKPTENGNYPVWMNRRAIKKAKIARKKKEKQKRKSIRASGKPWRK